MHSKSSLESTGERQRSRPTGRSEGAGKALRNKTKLEPGNPPNAFHSKSYREDVDFSKMSTFGLNVKYNPYKRHSKKYKALKYFLRLYREKQIPAKAMSFKWQMKFLKILRHEIKDTGGRWKREVKLQNFLKGEEIVLCSSKDKKHTGTKIEV